MTPGELDNTKKFGKDIWKGEKREKIGNVALLYILNLAGRPAFEQAVMFHMGVALLQ